MGIDALKDRIEKRAASLAVIGLGYVGLPVACEFARAGFEVLGVEIKEERVKLINAGRSPMEGVEPELAELLSEVTRSGKLHATSRYDELSNSDVVLIDVETPVDEKFIPRYDALRTAVINLGDVLKPGALVIVESTVYPGTVQDIILPILVRTSGLALNEGFYLGVCPERVMPGKLLANLRNISRVVGGMTLETTEAMILLYRQIVQADLDPADCITAELVKTIENTYRDVQIAFANEVALICEAVGGDVWQVRHLVNKSPQRQMHMPGAGVGGHCIPKDPWLLAYSANKNDVDLRMIPAARAVNNSMPAHVFQLLINGLATLDLSIKEARILVLGYAYLEDTDDTRNSPSCMLVELLQNAGAEAIVHDPYIPEYQGDLVGLAQGCTAAVLMVKHRQYYELNLKALINAMHTPVIIDGRALIDRESAKLAGVNLITLGRSFS